MLQLRLIEALSESDIVLDGSVTEIKGGHFSRCFEARRLRDRERLVIHCMKDPVGAESIAIDHFAWSYLGDAVPLSRAESIGKVVAEGAVWSWNVRRWRGIDLYQLHPQLSEEECRSVFEDLFAAIDTVSKIRGEAIDGVGRFDVKRKRGSSRSWGEFLRGPLSDPALSVQAIHSFVQAHRAEWPELTSLPSSVGRYRKYIEQSAEVLTVAQPTLVCWDTGFHNLLVNPEISRTKIQAILGWKCLAVNADPLLAISPFVLWCERPNLLEQARSLAEAAQWYDLQNFEQRIKALISWRVCVILGLFIEEGSPKSALRVVRLADRFL